MHKLPLLERLRSKFYFEIHPMCTFYFIILAVACAHFCCGHLRGFCMTFTSQLVLKAQYYINCYKIFNQRSFVVAAFDQSRLCVCCVSMCVRWLPCGLDGQQFLHRIQEDDCAAAGSAGVHRDPTQPEGQAAILLLLLLISAPLLLLSPCCAPPLFPPFSPTCPPPPSTPSPFLLLSFILSLSSTSPIFFSSFSPFPSFSLLLPSLFILLFSCFFLSSSFPLVSSSSYASCPSSLPDLPLLSFLSIFYSSPSPLFSSLSYFLLFSSYFFSFYFFQPPLSPFPHTLLCPFSSSSFFSPLSSSPFLFCLYLFLFILFHPSSSVPSPHLHSPPSNFFMLHKFLPSSESVRLSLQAVAAARGRHQHRYGSNERDLCPQHRCGGGAESRLRRYGGDYNAGDEDCRQAAGKVSGFHLHHQEQEVGEECTLIYCDVTRRWGEELLQEACSSLASEMTLDPSAPGGMVTYRRTLTLSLFYKFYLTVLQKLRKQVSEGKGIMLIIIIIIIIISL